MRLNLKIKQITAFLCLAAICALSPRIFAQTNAPIAKNKPKAEPPGGNRFLFIVDTSASMKSTASDTLQAVDDIIQSSASGQLHRGDTLGVWTFNTQLYPGVLPLQTWTPDDKNEIALRTAAFLKQQRYGKESRLLAALDGMYTVIKSSDIITIFLISNGQNPIQGTPFDDQINALYAQDVKEMKRDRKPIVTVLQAKRGKIIKFTVNPLPWPVVIPELPISIKTSEVASETSPETKPEEAAQKPTPVPTPNPAPQPAPTVVEKKTNAAPVVTPATPTPTPVSAPAPVVTSPPPAGNADGAATRAFLSGPAKAPAPISPPVVAQNPSPAVVTPPPKFIPPPQKTLPPPPPQREIVRQGSDSPGYNSHLAGMSLKMPPHSNAPGSAAPTSGDKSPAIATAIGRPKILLIGALVTAAIGFGLIALLYHRSRTVAGPSLITQTMSNPRKK